MSKARDFFEGPVLTVIAWALVTVITLADALMAWVWLTPAGTG